MKIIILGICTDNNDPKGLGRIRYVDYDDFVSGKENSVIYKEWDENDPFVASPFLPNNINYVPEKNQAVKIIHYNTDKTTVNQEYIAGPFTTKFDFTNQTFSQQVASTTYGVAIKSKINIVNDNDELINEKSKNAFIKNKDYGISGKYGSDVIFTDSGLVLRGGKLISKESATPKQKKELLDHPLMSKKTSKLQLKKFGKKLVIKDEVIRKTITDTGYINYLIEYEVDSITEPTLINYYVYKIKDNYGDKFKTTNFNEHTDITNNNYVLINNDNTTTTPTSFFDLTSVNGFLDLTIDNKVKVICSEIRTTLLTLKEDGLTSDFLNVSNVNNSFNNLNDLQNIYPFFFRPTVLFKNIVFNNDIEKNTKLSILDGVKLTSVGPQQSGLAWSSTSFNPTSRIVEELKKVLKEDNTSKEQTFASLVSDKMYLLSTDTNQINNPIDFNQLDSYEYTQDDYLNKINPNTYAIVRGEVLYEFLKSLYNVVTTHVHNINKPYARSDYSLHNEMESLFNKLENELLNKSIRIN